MDYCIKCSQPLFHGTIPHRCIADIPCPTCAAKDAELKRLRNETSIKNYFGTELADSANECMKLREENRRLREGVAEIKRKLFDLKINRAR